MNEAVFQPIPVQPKQQSVKIRTVRPSADDIGWTRPWKVAYALVCGMLMTLRHVFRKPTSFNYPNTKRHQSVRFRGIHRLQRHPDGKERCVGCGLCAAVCPSNAIYLEAKENTPENQVSHGERHATYYQIDMLRCIFCGFCEEACPEDAIVLGPNWEAASPLREDFIYTKDRLLVPVELKDTFRAGLTWPSKETESAPTSSVLPEYYQKIANRQKS